MSEFQPKEAKLAPKTELLRIGEIAGTHYTTYKRTDTVIIYGIGAPIAPDSGNLPDAQIIFDAGIDLFVPDYIGYGRSGGDFTPENCIKTFTQLFDEFSNGCVGRNSYEGAEMFLKYKRIIFVGRSFGGTYVPVLPRFNPQIKELAIFYPVVDSKSCGSESGEETNAQFLKSMREMDGPFGK